MSGRSVVRLALTLALAAFLMLPSLGQAAGAREEAYGSAVLQLLESLVPDAARAWFQTSALRGVTLKCGAGIDPNGKSCGEPLWCSAGIDPNGKPCGVTPKCGAGIDPDGKPCG